MQEKIQVKMSVTALFDFLLYHTYSKFAGFLTNILGMAVIFMGIIMLAIGKITLSYLLFYTMAGIAFLLYTPVLIWLRAKKQVEKNPQYKDVVSYIFADNGIEEIRKDKSKNYEWDTIIKVVPTPKTFGIYYAEDEAIIIPKEAFGDQYTNIMTIILNHVLRDRVKIR